MRYRACLYALLIASVAIACHSGGGGEGSSDARIALAGDRLVVSPGLRPQLSPEGSRVAYDWLHVPAAGGGPFYAVRTILADGSLGACLTCDRPEVPRNAGAPAYHPDGDQLVFSREKGVHAPVTGSAADPGGGLYNDLAIYDLSTDAIQVIYTTGDGLALPPNGSSCALHPHFSHDGSMITWADLTDGPAGVGEIFGRFRIGVGDYSDVPVPTLSNVRYFEVPGAKLVVVSGFSPDDSRIYAQCKQIAGQYDHEIDICEIELATGGSRRLLRTSGQAVAGVTEPAAYEEHLAPIPAVNDPDRVHGQLFFSSLERGVNRSSPGLLDWVTTDLWSADPRGNDPERLTSYNVPGSPQNDGFRAVVSKLGVDAAGTRVVYSLWRVGSEATANDDVFEIRIAEIERR